MSGRRPDYDVAIIEKNTEVRGTVGAAWKNEDGSIAIKLRSFIKIPKTKNIASFMLFPTKDRESGA